MTRSQTSASAPTSASVVGVESEVGRAQPVVVAAHAEPVERRADRRCGCVARGLRHLRRGDLRQAERGQHAGQGQQDSDRRHGSGRLQRFHPAIITPNAGARFGALLPQLHS